MGHKEELIKEQNQLNKRKNDIDKEIVKLSNEKNNVLSAIKVNTKNLNRLKNEHIEVSDHALIRYLERVDDMDLSIQIENILTSAMKLQIRRAGGWGIFTINEEHSIVVKDFTVVTVLNQEEGVNFRLERPKNLKL